MKLMVSALFLTLFMCSLTTLRASPTVPNTNIGGPSDSDSPFRSTTAPGTNVNGPSADSPFATSNLRNDREVVRDCAVDLRNFRRDELTAKRAYEDAKRMLMTSLTKHDAENLMHTYELCLNLKIDTHRIKDQNKSIADFWSGEINKIFKGDHSGAAQCYHALRSKMTGEGDADWLGLCLPDNNLEKNFPGGNDGVNTSNFKYNHCRSDLDAAIHARNVFKKAQADVEFTQKDCREDKRELREEERRDDQYK